MQNLEQLRITLIEMLEDLNTGLVNVAGAPTSTVTETLTSITDSAAGQRCSAGDVSKDKNIAKIKHTLMRMDKGEYWICQACGALMSKQQLVLDPFASVCTKCSKSSDGC